MSTSSVLGIGFAAFAATVLATAAAQEGPDLGETPSPDLIAAWDISVAPDGAGLPPGSGTAVEGAPVYAVNCLVCHGVDGRGDGPVGVLLETAPVDMHEAYTQDQADGQLFFTITRGRVTMPFYRDALSQEERWHVINYIRAEFGSE